MLTTISLVDILGDGDHRPCKWSAWLSDDGKLGLAERVLLSQEGGAMRRSMSPCVPHLTCDVHPDCGSLSLVRRMS